jgi:hypothetical protein
MILYSGADNWEGSGIMHFPFHLQQLAKPYTAKCAGAVSMWRKTACIRGMGAGGAHGGHVHERVLSPELPAHISSSAGCIHQLTGGLLQGLAAVACLWSNVCI